MSPPASTSPQPRAIGRYRIQSVLGEGAMGVVYRAHDPRLERDVAIKMLRLPDAEGERRARMTERLLREAKLVARLKHPGIVPVFDAGLHEGQAFMIIELIEGTSLEAILKEKGALAPDYAVGLAQQILEALAYAHEHEVIHRDIKPANVMIQPGGQVRVMDFGIAHTIDGAVESKGERCAGTPRYMAPEQFLGQTLDPRADLFSCGVTLFEMLTGARPFAGRDYASLRNQVVSAQHVPMQAAKPQLSAALCAVVDKALAKEPRNRFVGARQMVEALAACLEAGAVTSQPADGGETSPRERKEILDFIRKRIERKGDFPAISSYVARVTAAARSANSSAQLVSEAILKDFSLTNRVLRMVNSPYYRGLRKSVTTISNAVVILGMDTIISIAGGLSIFEHFHNRADVPELKRQTVLALMTALHARRVAREVNGVDPEEAFICGMLNNLGRLIVAFYFPDEFQAINSLMQEGEPNADHAARRVMGISFGELGRAMAEHWNFSDMIRGSMGGLSPDHKGRLITDVQRMQGVVSYASELGEATLIDDDVRRKSMLEQLSRQFEGLIDLKPKRLGDIIHESLRNAWDISHNVRVDLKQLGVATQLLDQVRKTGSKAEISTSDSDSGESKTGDSGGVGKVAAAWANASGLEPAIPSLTLSDPLDESDPHNAESEAAARQDVIMKTIMEITTTMMNPFNISDVLMMVLEGLYRGVGYRHVVLAMVNPGRDRIVFRFGLGEHIDDLGKGFDLPIDASAGVLGRCILEQAEIVVPDTRDRKHANALTPKIDGILGRAAVAVVPIVVQNRAIGMFFMDRDHQSALNAQTLRDTRALTSQAILAIMQSMSR